MQEFYIERCRNSFRVHYWSAVLAIRIFEEENCVLAESPACIVKKGVIKETSVFNR